MGKTEIERKPVKKFKSYAPWRPQENKRPKSEEKFRNWAGIFKPPGGQTGQTYHRCEFCCKDEPYSPNAEESWFVQGLLCHPVYF